jgi:hypothetical protein
VVIAFRTHPSRRVYGDYDRVATVKLYPASKTAHLEFWRALRAAGLPIEAPWIDWSGNENGSVPSALEWRDHWAGCISSAASADIVLLYMKEGERHCGALIEAGAALSAGRRVFAVLPEDGLSFRYHPNVTVFDSLSDAVSAIVKETISF